MTITVVLQKQATGYYSARAKGAGVDRGPNLLIADRRTRSIDEAKSHSQAALSEPLRGTTIKPTFVFEQLPDAPRRVKTGDQ